MTNLEMVAAELEAAKKKHPHFVDSLFPPRERYSPEWYDDALDMSRARLADAVKMKRCYLYQIIQCEAYEAFAAYAHDDLAHAKQELAQCAAVCIRAMEEVQKEMEKTNK